MAQVTVNIPSLPKDWHSTAVGLLGAIGLLVQEYTKAGTVTWEQIAIAVFVAVVCYFIPAKQTPVDEARIVETVTGVVNSTLGAKIPAVLLEQQKVSPLVSSAIDAAVQVAQEQANQPSAAVPAAQPAEAPGSPTLGG